MIPTEQQIAEAREICALIRAGKPVPCGKGPADQYLLALDEAISTALSDSKRKDEEVVDACHDAAIMTNLFRYWLEMCQQEMKWHKDEEQKREAAESRVKTLLSDMHTMTQNRIDEVKRLEAELAEAKISEDHAAAIERDGAITMMEACERAEAALAEVTQYKLTAEQRADAMQIELAEARREISEMKAWQSEHAVCVGNLTDSARKANVRANQAEAERDRLALKVEALKIRMGDGWNCHTCGGNHPWEQKGCSDLKCPECSTEFHEPHRTGCRYLPASPAPKEDSK